jgi:hypothetical protein
LESPEKITDIHELLLELDRLEELREELEERGLRSIEEIESRIIELSQQAETFEAVEEPLE